MPQLPNGKIDRRGLPAPEKAQKREKEYEEARTEIEEALTSVWAEALGLERVGVTDNFFEFGGDSILSIRAMALAKERGLTFSLQQLFEHQTIRELACNLKITEMNSIPEIKTSAFSLVSEEDQKRIPEDVEDMYPLTSLQAGMLYHMEMKPDTPVYHNVNSFHIRAQFDLDAFRQAIQKVIDRNAVLRTSFDINSYSEPMQLVHSNAVAEIVVQDLRHLSFEGQEAEIDAFVASEYNRALDLSRPPLVRFHIHRRTDDTFQYTLTENHAISDGWSTTSMLAEIFEYYFALLRGKSIIDEPLPAMTFRDFVYLERKTLESAECRNFWVEKLRDCAPTKLPRLHSETPYGTKKHKYVRLQFPEEVLGGLKHLARSISTPFKSVLLAAHMKALSLSCGQSDVLTALASNGRPEDKDGDKIRGLFINMLPFRLRLPEGTWAELVRKTFESEIEMLPFRRYPIAAVQKMWGRERLLETAFNFVHFHSLENVVRSGDLEILGFGNREMADTSFTLNASFAIEITSLTSHKLGMGLEYDATELSEDQMIAVARCYAKTLNTMASEPHANHNELDPEEMLSSQDKMLLGVSTLVDELGENFSF